MLHYREFIVDFYCNKGTEMSHFFIKLLGLVLLLSTVGLASCQSMFNSFSENTDEVIAEKVKGDL